MTRAVWWWPGPGEKVLSMSHRKKQMKFKKKPVVIEAVKFTYDESGMIALKSFCGDALGNVRKERHPTAKAEAEIGTLEDGIHLKVQHIATEGDWIIKGVQGEFYACKPDIFEATYEPAE